MEGTTVPRDDKTSADVAAVRKLDESVKKLLDAFEAAKPALERLEKAGYPGAEWLRYQLSSTLKDDTDGSLVLVLKAIEMFRTAKGNQGAADFEFYSKYIKLSPDAAAKEMVQNLSTDVESLDRIKAMRTHAATVA
jgi:hypothetical protein